MFTRNAQARKTKDAHSKTGDSAQRRRCLEQLYRPRIWL